MPVCDIAAPCPMTVCDIGELCPMTVCDIGELGPMTVCDTPTYLFHVAYELLVICRAADLVIVPALYASDIELIPTLQSPHSSHLV